MSLAATSMTSYAATTLTTSSAAAAATIAYGDWPEGTLLMGGMGVDELDGGADEDLLIGGVLPYDYYRDEAGLAAIQAEWTRPDLTNADRVNYSTSSTWAV